MQKTIELTASSNERFHYRGKHMRIINHRVVNSHRWKDIRGPLVYAVTDHEGTIRYFGKWVSPTALYSRWIRHDTIHHQASTREIYLTELDAGRGPLAVWSTSVDELRKRLPANTTTLSSKTIANSLEALWLHRWKAHLDWNSRGEKLVSGFTDAEFWR